MRPCAVLYRRLVLVYSNNRIIGYRIFEFTGRIDASDGGISPGYSGDF